MGRALVILRAAPDRNLVKRWVDQAPEGTRVEFKAPKRTVPQSDYMWALLTDIAQQKLWHGVRISADDWKQIFMDGLSKEMRIVPNLDGDGFVNLGNRSSDLSKEEMSDLIELIKAWGAQNDVTFNDRQTETKAATAA